MSPPLLGVGEDEGQSNAMMPASFASLESICKDGADLKEHNYMGLSDCSSVDSSNVSTTLEGNSRKDLNLKATKLRLRLPGSGSPERDSEPCPLNSVKLDEKLLFPLCPMNTPVKGNKRGFFDAMDGFTEQKDISTLEVNLMASSRPSVTSNVKVGSLKENPATQPAKMKEAISQNAAEVTPHTKSVNILNHVNGANNNNSAPSTKAQVIGWPPIRQSRKSTLASASKNTEEVDGKTSGSALFVKVSMDGAPYLRKVNLRTYSAYWELSSALQKMFSGFTIDQNASHGAQSKEMLGENKLNNLLHGSEYVLTYEDKDGDWMLGGDVPWEMFIHTCRRLRIMESSDAVGLAPRAVEKIKNRK